MSEKVLEHVADDVELNLLNEKTLNILKRSENIYGLDKCQNVILNYAKYIVLKKNGVIKFGNYNIIINNNSEYTSGTELVEIIKDILQAEDIIKSNYRYLNRDELKKEKSKKKENLKIEEDLIIIDSNVIDSNLTYCKKEIIDFMNSFPEKIYILVDNEKYRTVGLLNANLGNYMTWTINIDKISKENKISYITNFLKENEIKLATKNTFLDKLSEEPFWIVKDEILNIVLECKSNNIQEIDDNVIKNCLKRKYYKKEGEKNAGKEPLKELEEMIGMESVKKQVEQIANYIKINKKRGKMPMLHMCFMGNPGTGKTTVARLIGRIFSDMKILSDKHNFVEIHGRDLIAKYVGWTAKNVHEKIEEAKGGVLFIDEAYSIIPREGRGFESEAIATLIKEMEDKRDEVCIILAGYSNEMEELLKSNPGFESRIQFKIDFEDYNEEELYEIFKSIAKNEDYKISTSLKEMLIEYFKKEKLKENFSNARCVRNLFEKVKFEQADRVSKNGEENINLIKKVDVERVISKVSDEVKDIKIGFRAFTHFQKSNLY